MAGDPNVAVVRRRQSPDRVGDELVIAIRVEGGRITHGVDLCGPALIDFWKRHGGT